MNKKCPKCGAERQMEDGGTPAYECPSCGIVYAKYENKNRQEIINDAPSVKRKDFNTSRKTNFNSPKKVISPILVISLFVALIISFVGYKFYSNYQVRQEIAERQAIEERLSLEKKMAEETYSNELKVIIGEMLNLVKNSAYLVDAIEKAWKDAIYSKNNKRDFNVAISDVRQSRKDDILSVEKMSEEIARKIKSLTPIVDKKKDYQRLKELYFLFNKYANMAITPSGSLQTYSRQNNDLIIEIKSAIKELEMMI